MTETAKTYGGALYELCRDEGIADRVMEELTAVCKIFRANPEYTELLRLHSVPKAERRRALEESFGGRVHEYLLNFMKLLVDNGTIAELPMCREAYSERNDEDAGIVRAEVYSAVELTEDEEKRLTKKLGDITGKRVILRTRLDPALIGGVRLSMGGKLYDGTVLSRLDEVRSSLKDAVL